MIIFLATFTDLHLNYIHAKLVLMTFKNLHIFILFASGKDYISCKFSIVILINVLVSVIDQGEP